MSDRAHKKRSGRSEAQRPPSYSQTSYGEPYANSGVYPPSSSSPQVPKTFPDERRSAGVTAGPVHSMQSYGSNPASTISSSATSSVDYNQGYGHSSSTGSMSYGSQGYNDYTNSYASQSYSNPSSSFVPQSGQNQQWYGQQAGYSTPFSPIQSQENTNAGPQYSPDGRYWLSIKYDNQGNTISSEWVPVNSMPNQ